MDAKKAPKKVHCIGIAGKGMSAVALILRERGWEITGSDEGFYPPVSDYLQKAGIAFNEGYKKEHIPADADVIMVGKNAKLVPETNEEVRAAMASGKPVKSFPEILEELTEKTDNIVVAGSYGKSTCTGLLAWCLKESGKDPSYFIGEVTKGFEAYGHSGSGSVFVLEGDEYPSANWDTRSKFLHYHAHSVLLTSATHDHVNVYPTHEDYLRPFRTLVSALPHDGLVVANFDEPFARGIAGGYTGKKVFYSMHNRTVWHPENVRYGTPTSFDLYNGTEKIISLTTSQLGAHNVENIVGISALLLEKGLLSPEELQKNVATFEGAKRRMELLSPRSKVPVYEGFGSSYEKAKSAIAAAKLHFPARRLVVIFEPHTFTWRNKSALYQYDDVFTGADKVYIFEPATQGSGAHAQLTQADIVERVRSAGFKAEAISDPRAALEAIERELGEQDVILILTSGEIGGLIKTIPAMAEQKFPA